MIAIVNKISYNVLMLPNEQNLTALEAHPASIEIIATPTDQLGFGTDSIEPVFPPPDASTMIMASTGNENLVLIKDQLEPKPTRRRFLVAAGVLLGGILTSSVSAFLEPGRAAEAATDPETKRYFDLLGDFGFLDPDPRLRALAFQKSFGVKKKDGVPGKVTRRAIDEARSKGFSLQKLADDRDYTKWDGKNSSDGKGIDIIIDKDLGLAMLFRNGKATHSWAVSVGDGRMISTHKYDKNGKEIMVPSETRSDNFSIIGRFDGNDPSREFEGATLYKPLYFSGGQALHGCSSKDKNGNLYADNSKVTGERASGGCVRTSHGMMDILWTIVDPTLKKGNKVSVKVIGKDRQ